MYKNNGMANSKKKLACRVIQVATTCCKYFLVLIVILFEWMKAFQVSSNVYDTSMTSRNMSSNVIPLQNPVVTTRGKIKVLRKLKDSKIFRF